MINFSNADLTAENGTVGNLTSTDGGKTWTGVFTPNQNIEDATNLIHVASTYTDPDGNAGTEATSGNYSIDTLRPSIGITGVTSSGNTLLATFTFSGAIDPSTFTAQDVLVTGAMLKSLVSNGGSSYTALLTPSLSGGGTITASVQDGTFADFSDNTGIGASKSFQVTTTKPTSASDWIVGTSGNNTLKGGGGNDVIRGGKGNDTISGDGGKDLLDFSDGTKGIKFTLSQANNAFTKFDGHGAGLGTDKYRDMEGVVGTKFGDTLTGSSSSDTIAGLGGNDILRGGHGNDFFVFEPKGGSDRIMDFEDSEGGRTSWMPATSISV